MCANFRNQVLVRFSGAVHPQTYAIIARKLRILVWGLHVGGAGVERIQEGSSGEQGRMPVYGLPLFSLWFVPFTSINLRRQDPSLQGVADQLGLTVKPQFAQQISTVGLSRPRADPQPSTDLGVRAAFGG